MRKIITDAVTRLYLEIQQNKHRELTDTEKIHFLLILLMLVIAIITILAR